MRNSDSIPEDLAPGPSGTCIGDEDVVVALHFPDCALGMVSRAVSYHSDDGLLKKARRSCLIAFVCVVSTLVVEWRPCSGKMAPISIKIHAWVKMRGFSYSLFMATGKCQAGAPHPMTGLCGATVPPIYSRELTGISSFSSTPPLHVLKARKPLSCAHIISKNTATTDNTRV